MSSTDLDSHPPRSEPKSKSASGERRFEGKVALITGSSDQGIGGAVAERLVREGAAVALVSLEQPKRLLNRLRRMGQAAEWRLCDIRRSADVKAAVDDFMGEFGQINLLINNAGLEFARSLDQLSDEQWQELLEVNLSGTIRMTRAVLPLLPEPGGVIVNVASALALGGSPSFSVYSASKAGLIGFTQSLAWELAPRRIRVVSVAPGVVVTPMTFKHISVMDHEQRARIDACHPLGVGSPHDVAAAIAFLASDDARWITGVSLPLGWAPHYPLPVGLAGGGPS